MSLQKVAHCPACGSTSFTPFLICKDYTTTGESFHVEQCTKCDMAVTNPRPTEKDSKIYYQSPKYISHTSAATGLMDSIYLIMRRFTLKRKYHLIKPYLTSNTLLDVGCGTGNFLTYCSSTGVTAFGVEPSPEARATFKSENVVASLDDLADQKFDVITLWHVLEHIYDLSATVEKLKYRLKENGTIFIAVPNLESADAKHYQERWAAYDVPRHLWHFSQKNMAMFVDRSGLTLKDIMPMRLDSFYVSLLTEKNIAGGKLTLIAACRAVLQGLRSNLLARKKMNYSSLIYIVQK